MPVEHTPVVAQSADADATSRWRPKIPDVQPNTFATTSPLIRMTDDVGFRRRANLRRRGRIGGDCRGGYSNACQRQHRQSGKF